MKLKQVETFDEIAQTRELFEEYSAWLNVDLCFQGFENELRELPGAYQPPNGRLLLAMNKDVMAGCIALRKIGDETCEMKRLYVRPAFRGLGVGRKLVVAIIQEAHAIGYGRMRLDTLPHAMKEAISLYHSFGFREIEPYYANPVEGTLYMELDLRQ
jgi:ribosomal protein S18 acetylase RimI-like enzyme